MLLTTTSKINAIKEYMKSGDYDAAVRIAEKVNPEKITSVRDLMTLSNAFLKKRRYEDAKSIYVEMHNHAQTHKVLVGLIELCLKTNSPEEAEVYIREFRKLEPENPERLIYRYRVDAMLGKGPEYLVKSLKKLKDEDYTDVWGLELAKAYYKMGDYEKCAQECKDTLLWFAGTDSAAKAHILLGACAEKGVSVTLPEARPRREENYYDDDEPSDVPVIAASVKEPAPQPAEDAPFNLSAALREAVSETIDEDRRAAEEALENAETAADDAVEAIEEDIEAVEDIKLPSTDETIEDEVAEAADEEIVDEEAVEQLSFAIPAEEAADAETLKEETADEEETAAEVDDTAGDEDAEDFGFFDEDAVETVSETVEDAVEPVAEVAEETGETALETAEETVETATELAEDAVEGAAEAVEAVEDAAEELEDDIPEDATVPIHLPEDFGADDLVTVAVMKAKMQDDDDEDIVLHDFFPEEKKHVSRSSWDNEDAVPTLVTLPSSYSTADSKPAAPKTDDFFFDEDAFNSAANDVEESDIETEALEQDYDEELEAEEAAANETDSFDDEELEEEELEEDYLAADTVDLSKDSSPADTKEFAQDSFEADSKDLANSFAEDNLAAAKDTVADDSYGADTAADVAFATDGAADTEEDKEAFLKSLSASVEKSLNMSAEEDGQLSFFAKEEPVAEAPIPTVKTDDDFLDISANIAAAVADEMENGSPEADEVSKEPTKVHADLTAQALDAMLREDDEAIERALRGMLSDR